MTYVESNTRECHIPSKPSPPPPLPPWRALHRAQPRLPQGGEEGRQSLPLNKIKFYFLHCCGGGLDGGGGDRLTGRGGGGGVSFTSLIYNNNYEYRKIYTKKVYTYKKLLKILHSH